MVNNLDSDISSNGGQNSDAEVTSMGPKDEHSNSTSLTPIVDPPSKLIVGEYEIDHADELGQGTFGNVFRGVHVDPKTGVKTPIAVKKINSNVYMNKIELETVQKLQNPHIVQYHDVVTQPDAVYVFMNLCDSDLAKHIDLYGKLSAQNLTTVSSQLASAYLSVAERSIVHRDIKSCNILLTYEKTENENETVSGEKVEPVIKNAQLTDFGCSRSGENVRKESAVLAGTPLYMAPEVGANLVSQNAYTHAIDMWSIGCVLYECATGVCPFTDQQLCRIFLRATNPSNCTGNVAPDPGELPGQLQEIIPRLLSIVPDDRPTAQELYDCLVKHKLYKRASINTQSSSSSSSLNLKDKLSASYSNMKKSGSTTALKRLGAWIKCVKPQSAEMAGNVDADADSYEKSEKSVSSGS